MTIDNLNLNNDNHFYLGIYQICNVVTNGNLCLKKVRNKRDGTTRG